MYKKHNKLQKMLFHSGNYYAIILKIYNKYRRVLNEYEC